MKMRQLPGRVSPTPAVAALFLLISVALPCRLAAAPDYWGSLEVGAYAVGFKPLELTDSSRTFGPGQSRVLKVGVWYPAAPNSSSEKTRFQQYIDFFEGDAAEPSPDMPGARQRWLRRLRDEDARQRALALPTASSADVSALGGVFPLIIYAPGYRSTSTIHIATMEYLASHGYVVASSASTGAIPGGMTFDSIGLDAQVRDVEFLIASLTPRRDVDSSSIAVIGFSFGAGAGVVSAMRRGDIRAIVSLDGVEGMSHGFDLTTAAAGYDAANLRAAILRIGRPAPDQADQALFREFRLSDRLWVQVVDTVHLDFVPSTSFAIAAGDSGATGNPAVHAFTTETILAFLEATFREDSSLSARLERLTAQYSPQLKIEKQSLPAEAHPPPGSVVYHGLMDADTFAATLNEYRTYHAEFTELPLLTEGQFDSILNEALARGAAGDADSVATLWRASYPQSAQALAGSGDALLQLGRMEEARAAYEAALKIHPGLVYAVEGLARIDRASQ